jgi:hypothetical protein
VKFTSERETTATAFESASRLHSSHESTHETSDPVYEIDLILLLSAQTKHKDKSNTSKRCGILLAFVPTDNQ